ncbi:hypothetical protein JCM8115_000527 [Rhodotorula mucilaginosa]
MPLPVAELYSEPRSPFLFRSLAPTARSLSRASQVTPITTRTSTGRRVSKATFRTSVSFKPTDDPFAAFTPVEETFDADWHLVQAEEARKSHSNSEGHSVSNEGMASGRRPGTLSNRRASFLRSLWAPFSSSSSSSPKKPHRSRSAAELSISRPMDHAPTLSIAPRNPVAALVSIREAEAATAAQSTSNYPSGTNSLHRPPTAVSKRASSSNFFLKRGSKKSREPAAEPSELNEIGLALTTDEVASASVAAAATQQQQGHMPPRASLSASLPVPRLRGSASWSVNVNSAAGRSRAASIATDTHHRRPCTANFCVSSVSDAVPTSKTSRGYGKGAGLRRLSIFALLPSFAPSTEPSMPRRPSSAAAAGRLRSETCASLRSVRSRGPATPRPPRSVARPPSRTRLRPDNDAPTPLPSIIDESPCSQEHSADENSRRSSDEVSARLLASIDFERRRLVAERERLVTDLGAIIRGAEDRCNRLYESSLGRAGSTSSLSMQERPTGTMSPSSRQFDLRDSIIEEDDDDDNEEGALQSVDVRPEQDPAQAMLVACQEALEALSVRLALTRRATDDGRNLDRLQDSCDISLATTPSRQSARSSDSEDADAHAPRHAGRKPRLFGILERLPIAHQIKLDGFLWRSKRVELSDARQSRLVPGDAETRASPHAVVGVLGILLPNMVCGRIRRWQFRQLRRWIGSFLLPSKSRRDTRSQPPDPRVSRFRE